MGEGELMQTFAEQAEMVARFRTPPGLSWEPLRDDILTLLEAAEARGKAAKS